MQSKVKWLEKLEIVEVDEEDTSALRLKFPPCPRSGNYPVIADGVGKSYDGETVFPTPLLLLSVVTRWLLPVATERVSQRWSRLL